MTLVIWTELFWIYYHYLSVSVLAKHFWSPIGDITQRLMMCCDYLFHKYFCLGQGSLVPWELGVVGMVCGGILVGFAAANSILIFLSRRDRGSRRGLPAIFLPYIHRSSMYHIHLHTYYYLKIKTWCSMLMNSEQSNPWMFNSVQRFTRLFPPSFDCRKATPLIYGLLRGDFEGEYIGHMWLKIWTQSMHSESHLWRVQVVRVSFRVIVRVNLKMVYYIYGNVKMLGDAYVWYYIKFE